MILSASICPVGVFAAAAPECVALAAADLVRDLCRLLGRPDGAVLTKDPAAPVRVRVTGEGEPESYTVAVGRDAVEIEGADGLGAAYGVYAFSTRCLGVSPVHLFTGLFPAARQKIELKEERFASLPRRTKYRGWFLNDEDLLGAFHGGGGTREIDYPFYQTVMRPEVLDTVLETALRLEMNLIIPSSFIDILNPPEKALVDRAWRRGFYISQHHVEPLGVSWFSAEKYFAANGGPAPGQHTDPEQLKKVWRHYVRAWAPYGDRVIWQLGLRGAGDRAVWETDPSFPEGDAARGDVISRAVKTEWDLVRQELGRSDFPATMTFWRESAALYDHGHIRLPQGVIPVFSDEGYTQTFGEDLYGTARVPGVSYGIYYHLGFWALGPHLTECSCPEKILWSLREAERMQALSYVIVNVSNLRPFVFGASLVAAFLREGEGFDLAAWQEDWYRRIYGDLAPAVQRGMDAYYRSFAQYEEKYLRDLCKRELFHRHSCGDLPFPCRSVPDGVLIGTRQNTYDPALLTALEESAPRWEKTAAYWDGLREKISPATRSFFDVYQRFPPRFLAAATRFRVALWRGEIEKAEGAVRDALREMRVLEEGAWSGWLDGEVKLKVGRWLGDEPRISIRGWLEKYKEEDHGNKTR